MFSSVLSSHRAEPRSSVFFYLISDQTLSVLAPVVESQRLRLISGSLHPSVGANGRTDSPTDGSGSSHPRGEKCRLMISRHS